MLKKFVSIYKVPKLAILAHKDLMLDLSDNNSKNIHFYQKFDNKANILLHSTAASKPRIIL